MSDKSAFAISYGNSFGINPPSLYPAEIASADKKRKAGLLSPLFSQRYINYL